MKATLFNPAESFHKSLFQARRHFGFRHFSAKRMGIYAAMTFICGIFLSFQCGPHPLIAIPVLLEWFITSRTVKKENPEQHLDNLLEASAGISANEIVEGLLSRYMLSPYSKKGIAEMGAELLVKLREKDPTKFGEVLGVLEVSPDKYATAIVKKLDEISGIPFAYRGHLAKARQHFAYASLSARRIVRNGLATLFLFDYSPVDDIFPHITFESTDNYIRLAWLAGTLGVYLLASGLVDALSMARRGWKANPNGLLDNLVQSSLQDVPNTAIAKDLVFYNRRGLKKMGREYLYKLRERCGTKFYQVLALLQQSAKGRSLTSVFIKGG